MKVAVTLFFLSSFFSTTVLSKDEVPQFDISTRMPTLEKDGKTVVVSAQEYIEFHLKDAKGKYALISVPDGWNTDGYLVEVATKKKIISFSGSTGKTLVGQVSPDNKLLAAEKIFSRAVTIWNIASTEEIRTLPTLEFPLIEIAFSKDGHFVGALTNKQEIVIWEVETGTELRRIANSGGELSKELETVKKWNSLLKSTQNWFLEIPVKQTANEHLKSIYLPDPQLDSAAIFSFLLLLRIHLINLGRLNVLKSVLFQFIGRF